MSIFCIGCIRSQNDQKALMSLKPCKRHRGALKCAWDGGGAFRRTFTVDLLLFLEQVRVCVRILLASAVNTA